MSGGSEPDIPADLAERMKQLLSDYEKKKKVLQAAEPEILKDQGQKEK